MVKKYNILLILLLIICMLPAIWSLFHPGFFLTDDGNWMVIRFSAFYDALKHGQFPVRFLPRLNQGYGYPVADFLYPGFMYLGVVIHVLGFNFINTIKVILGLSLLSSGIFSFLWLRKHFSSWASFAGALMYVYFPYHLWDIYRRGSVGELLALAVVPLIFWQLERRSFLGVTIGISLLVVSHNILALLFLPIIIGYMFIQKVLSIKYKVLSILFGLGLAAFFWMPALFDTQYTVFTQTAVSEFFKYFVIDLNIIGIAFACIFFAAFIVLYKSKNPNSLFYFFLIVVCISLFLAHPFSSFIWQISPLSSLVQFPFRFLSIAAFGSAFLTAGVLQALTKKWQIWIIIIFISLVYISAWNYLSPKIFQNYPDTFYSTNEDTTTVKNEYMPRWVKVTPMTHPGEKVTIENGLIDSIIDRGTNLRFAVTMKERGLVKVNIIYFPGWHATIDGKQSRISYANLTGVIEVAVPTGRHLVEISFGETAFRLFADLISIISIFILLWLVVHFRQYRLASFPLHL